MANEDLTREEHVEGSSNRAFGVVFAGAFLVIAVWPLFSGEGFRWWSCGVSAIFAAIVFTKPSLLATLNRMWIKLGVLMGRVVSPIALGLLFYLVLAPLGTVMRLTGKDPLRLKFDSVANSYWIQREPPGPAPDSMTNQF